MKGFCSCYHFCCCCCCYHKFRKDCTRPQSHSDQTKPVSNGFAFSTHHTHSSARLIYL